MRAQDSPNPCARQEAPDQTTAPRCPLARAFEIAAGVVICVVLIAWLATVRDYGLTWDERVQATYGELALQYFGSLGRDRAVNEFLNLRFYGPPFEMAAALLYGLMDYDKFLVRHVLSILAGAATLAGLWIYARHWRFAAAGLLAVVALAMLPRFYGHAPFNSKDIPFAAAFTWAMAAIAWLLLARERGWRHWLWCGAAIGAALALRMGALLLPAFLAAGGVIRLLQLGRLNRNWLLARERRHLVARLAGCGAIAWFVMVAAWPWAHQNPLLHPWLAFRMSNNFASVYEVAYRGEQIMSNALPRTYLPHMLSITTPPAHLLLLVGGLLAALLLLKRDWRSRQSLLVALTLLWFCFPVGYVMLTHPNLYDGIRHFLFILPALAMLCALLPALILQTCQSSLMRSGLALGALLLLLLPAISLARLHPYQMTYYNTMVGGVSQAWRHYETDYWSSSYKEAMAWINQQAAARSANDPLVVVVAANPNNFLAAAHYAEPNVQLHAFLPGGDASMLPARFDYYVALNRYGWPGYFPQRAPVQMVGRQGAVFTLIRGSDVAADNSHPQE